jgi:hypothetical protein
MFKTTKDGITYSLRHVDFKDLKLNTEYFIGLNDEPVFSGVAFGCMTLSSYPGQLQYTFEVTGGYGLEVGAMKQVNENDVFMVSEVVNKKEQNNGNTSNNSNNSQRL